MADLVEGTFARGLKLREVVRLPHEMAFRPLRRTLGYPPAILIMAGDLHNFRKDEFHESPFS